MHQYKTYISWIEVFWIDLKRKHNLISFRTPFYSATPYISHTRCCRRWESVLSRVQVSKLSLTSTQRRLLLPGQLTFSWVILNTGDSNGSKCCQQDALLLLISLSWFWWSEFTQGSSVFISYACSGAPPTPGVPVLKKIPACSQIVFWYELLSRLQHGKLLLMFYTLFETFTLKKFFKLKNLKKCHNVWPNQSIADSKDCCRPSRNLQIFKTVADYQTKYSNSVAHKLHRNMQTEVPMFDIGCSINFWDVLAIYQTRPTWPI